MAWVPAYVPSVKLLPQVDGNTRSYQLPEEEVEDRRQKIVISRKVICVIYFN